MPVVLAGDYNVVPTEADIYQPNSWQGDALVDPAARQAFAASSPRAGPTPCWPPTRRCAPNLLVVPAPPLGAGQGLRIDHLLLSPALAERLTATGVDKPVRGEPGASDHAPTWADLTD